MRAEVRKEGDLLGWLDLRGPNELYLVPAQPPVGFDRSPDDWRHLAIQWLSRPAMYTGLRCVHDEAWLREMAHDDPNVRIVSEDRPLPEGERFHSPGQIGPEMVEAEPQQPPGRPPVGYRKEAGK